MGSINLKKTFAKGKGGSKELMLKIIDTEEILTTFFYKTASNRRLQKD